MHFLSNIRGKFCFPAFITKPICHLEHFFKGQLFLGIVISLLFFNCSNTNSKNTDSKTVIKNDQSVAAVAALTPSSLPPAEYLLWLEKQQGITYDKQENDQFRLTLVYKPVSLEAALSGGYISGEELQKYIALKAGYHYFTLKCLDKKMSVTKPVSKEAILYHIREGLYVVKNSSDTIRDFITEIFPASLMNQPHEILMLVPSDSKDNELSVGVRGRAFTLPDLNIHITQTQIKSLPEVKI